MTRTARFGAVAVAVAMAMAPPPRAAAGEADAAPGVRPLRALAAEATAIATVAVLGTELLDGGRLHVQRVRVLGRVGGEIGDAIGIVEIRGSSTRPPLLAAGERAVVLLAQAPDVSYLAEQLPPGRYFTIVGAREGVIVTGDEAERLAIERAVGRAREIGLAGAAMPGARRELALAELESRNRRLAADAVLELSMLGAETRLSDAEVATVTAAVGDRRLPPATRAGLIDVLAKLGGARARPALATVTPDSPAVLDALLAARSRVGDPPTPNELEALIARDDPDVRAAAARALARAGDAAAVVTIERVALHDPALAVRTAAVDALGASRAPRALPVLARTFDAGDRALRQRSAQAILAIGGAAADDALVELALHGRSNESQTYAALLLVTARGPQHPAVRRLTDAAPSSSVRYVLEHGLEFRDTHAH